MRKIGVCTAIMLMFVCSSLSAKPIKQVTDNIANSYVESVTKDIKLTSAQRDSIQSLATDFGDKLQTAREMEDKAAAVAFMKIAREELDKAVSNIIGSDQMSLMKKAKEDRRVEKIAKLKNKK